MASIVEKNETAKKEMKEETHNRKRVMPDMTEE